MRGIRLVIEEFRADVTKTRKDGSRGRLRIDYGDPRKPEKPIAWLWKFIDGAKTAGELYGRALVVIAAEQYASPARRPEQPAARTRCAGPRTRTIAAKALTKLAGPHLPATLKQLEKAVAKAHSEHEKASQWPHNDQPRRPARSSEQRVAEPAEADALEDELDVDERQDRNLDDEKADVDLEVGEVSM